MRHLGLACLLQALLEAVVVYVAAGEPAPIILRLGGCVGRVLHGVATGRGAVIGGLHGAVTAGVLGARGTGVVVRRGAVVARRVTAMLRGGSAVARRVTAMLCGSAAVAHGGVVMAASRIVAAGRLVAVL